MRAGSFFSLSLAGWSYPIFLQVVNAQRKQYWAIVLCFIKEKLPRKQKSTFRRKCCAIHSDHPWEQWHSPGMQGGICCGYDTGRDGSACVPVVLQPPEMIGSYWPLSLFQQLVVTTSMT